MKTSEFPNDGLTGLKQNWRADALSGFLVFLLALPLSLGIAKASEFPPAMGVLTAMIGGLFVSLFAGSRLTIKGPAAGLITVCSGAVIEMGGGEAGWHLACGVIVVTAIIQIIFGFLKFGSLSDFFPAPVVHGMLAAIGVIIIAKEVPVLLGVTALAKGLSPIALYLHFPEFINHANPRIALIGVLTMMIIFGLPALGGVFKKIPAPMIALVVMIPLGQYLDIQNSSPGSLVSIGDFWAHVGFNADFGAIGTLLFWKYVLLFLLVNSLESLLTVKAIDGLDPWKRKSDYNKDLTALGTGNGISGLMGGLPMISEVVRSAANVNFGGRTVWSNFFHGLFLLLAMLLMIPAIEMIPNATLAAMLIFAGYRLASPQTFIDTYKIGAEQVVIFLVTIFVTMAEDLMWGILAGIVIKFIIHLFNGARIGNLFTARYEILETHDGPIMVIQGAALFSNYMAFRKAWARIRPGQSLTLDFSYAKLVDHSFMEQLHRFEADYHRQGGKVSIVGLDELRKFSSHPLAARKFVSDERVTKKNRAQSRHAELQEFASIRQYIFDPRRTRNADKFRGFPIQKRNSILYEENILTKTFGISRIDISDLAVIENGKQAWTETRITALRVSITRLVIVIPDFTLEWELHRRSSPPALEKAIEIAGHPAFSERYKVIADDEVRVRHLFNDGLIRFLEEREDMHIECHNNVLLLYKRRALLGLQGIARMEKFADDLLHVMQLQRIAQEV